MGVPAPAPVATVSLLAALLPILLVVFSVLVIVYIIVLIARLYKAVIRTANATEETNRLLRIFIKDLREKNAPASSESSSSESV